MNVTLKYARFSKIGNVALNQERTNLIVSKFQYTQAADQQNRNQYLGVSHLSGIPFSFPIILLSEIRQPDYVHVNTCNNVQKCIRMQTSMEHGILSDPFQCKPDMAFV